MPTIDAAACIEQLHETAREKISFADFGDPIYREALLTLLQSYDADCNIGQEGWRYICESLTQFLIARLYTQRGWAAHSNVLSAPLQRPIVIAGFGRTGTTALHKLLSQDPQSQVLELWIGRRPMIRPPRKTWASYPEYADCIATVESFKARSPSYDTVHELVASEPEECANVLIQSFTYWGWGVGLPSYATWLEKQDMREPYRRYIDVLRLIGTSDSRRWLLKDPFHIMELNSLLCAVPDARVIQTHRDPLSAIPSLYSLYQKAWHPDIRFKDSGLLGQRICDFWRKALERSNAVRERSPANFYDVDHRQIAESPLRVVRSIYDHFGLTLSDEAEKRMRDWISASPTSRHGKHNYNLASFNVATDQIRDMFADYRAVHGFR